MRRNQRRFVVLGAALASALVPLTLIAPFTASTSGASSDVVNVVGYSIVKNAFSALESGFENTNAGSGVSFTNSFGASGTEATNVANGQAADFVNLSLTPDLTTLVNAGKVAGNWAQQEVHYGLLPSSATKRAKILVDLTPGILTDSVVVFVVRKGNPLNIKSWSDLTKNGVQIVTPDPRSSGSAKWNLLAAYVAGYGHSHSDSYAQGFLEEVLKNVISQPSSGSTALSSFVAGTGNVLLAYESDANGAVAAGQPVQIVTPSSSVVIQNPAALTLSGQNNPGAVAFYKYVFSPAGQAILARLGYRSVLKTIANDPVFAKDFTKVPNLETVYNINPKGWVVVNGEFFSPNVAFGAKSKVYPTQGIVTYWEQQTGH